MAGDVSLMKVPGYFLLLVAGFVLLLASSGCQSSVRRDPYSASIVRTFANEAEQRLITLAEQAPVPEETLQKMAGWMAGKPGPTKDWRYEWWIGSFDGVRDVQYFTPAALDYYQVMLAKFRRGDFRDTHGIKMLSATLDYKAEATRHDSLELRGRKFPKGYLVTISLSWSQYCGSLCAMSCGAGRQVVFDEAGEILAVMGDDDERMMFVSEITTLYVPDTA